MGLLSMAYDSFKTEPMKEILPPEQPYPEDPHQYTGSTAAITVAQMGIQARENLDWALHNFDKPYFMLSLDVDSIVDNSKHQEFFNQTAKVSSGDKSYKVMSGVHDDMMNPEKFSGYVEPMLEFMFPRI
jgi:hypothetical protein